MGNAVSRDHAKLPFGYTHARKDHSFNTSSVSRRRLASRLLRTSDTTSVTPFPMQDGSSSVASIPELVEISPVSLFISIHQQQPSLLSSQSISTPAAAFTQSSSNNNHGQQGGNAHTSNTSSSNSDGASVSFVTPSEFGTGTGAAVIVSAPVPESDTLETAVRSSSLRRRSSATAPEAMSPSAARSQYAAAAAHGNAHAILKNAGQAPALTTSAPGSSLAWSTSSHQAGMTNSDVAHAAITDDSTAPSSPPSSSIAGCEQGSCGSSLDQKQRISESEGTLERHSKDMDIISALGIADRPHQYDFFSTPSSPPSSLAAQPAQSHQQRPSMLTKQDSMALFVSGSRILEMHRQGDLETRTESTAIRADFRSHPSYKRTLSYELKMTERELQRLHEEDEEFCDSWDANTLQLEGCPGGETDSILDEDLEQLNPIPFAELPNLTNIGLCSHGIVKLSSNIRLLASATCVQICCNELSRIPAEIGFLRNLTLLDLSKNKLTSLPESIMHLTKLVDLKLSGNQLETLPAGIGGLVKLAALSLDDNQLESLPPQIGLIKGLISLDLTNNPITVLPAEVGKLQFLRRLHLDGCPLVRKFEHQPLHSPPTLLELAARVMVRHDVPVPPMTLPHLKTYLKSAHTCSFCDGPYFDSWVKRGKMIEKNEMLIPLEYTLCQPHWNTEMERIKLLFCQRPITAPPTKPSTAVTQSSLARSKGGDKKTMVKRQSSRAAEAYSTLEVDYQSSTASSAATTPASEIPPPVPTTSFPATTPVRPRARKFASDSDDRARPLSLIGSRLSMLLSSKGDKRERPAATSRTTSLPVVTTAASVMGTAGSSTTTLLPSAPTFYPVSSSSSSSAGPSCNRAPAPAPVVSLLNAEEPTATIAPVRPTARRAATNNFLARAAFKLTRPLSMGSSAFESMGRLSTSATSLNPPLSASATAD